MRLAAEGDAADREAEAPVVVVRGVDVDCVEVQVVGARAITANRGPVDTDVACTTQVGAWVDEAAPDKHQRRLHNSIPIS